MLSLYEYILLENDEKKEILWKDGLFIANVKNQREAFSLYSLYDYFVEITMAAENKTHIMPFRQGVRLEKYLEEIDITSL